MMHLLREKYPGATTDTIWKDYYNKGHEISFHGTHCVTCNQYVVDMSECDNIPECKGLNVVDEKPLDNSVNSLVTTGVTVVDPKLVPHTVTFTGAVSDPLLTINHDGTVEATTIENACLAGKMFVESIRYHHLNFSPSVTSNTKSDEVLNKTEDLLLLSKILDSMKKENITEAVSLIHTARKSDRDKIEDLQKEVATLKQQLSME